MTVYGIKSTVNKESQVSAVWNYSVYFWASLFWPLTTAQLSAVTTAISLTSSVTQSPHLRKASISSCFCAVMSVLVGLAFFLKSFQLSQEHTVVPSYEINQMKRVTALSRAPPRKAGQFILLMAWGICNSWVFLVMELIGQSHRSSLWKSELSSPHSLC